MARKITIQNIKNFIIGNARYLGSKARLTDMVLIEQVAYRSSKCPDCLTAGHCLGSCECSVPGRWFVDATCNEDRFPDLMDKETWEQFKIDNNIDM